MTNEVSKAIEAGLDRYDQHVLGSKTKNSFVLAYLEDSTLIGGLRANIKDKDYYIKHLWVEDTFRGNGVGASLMLKAENEANEKKCKHIWVDTMSYQAPDFYYHLGYKEIACVKHYRDIHDRIFFRKDIE